MSQAPVNIENAVPCYFMCVDILGFSNIITNLNPDQQVQRMESWVALVETTASVAGVKETQLLSDTLFVREEDSLDGLKRLLKFARLLLEGGLEENLPLRGSIVHGNAAWGRMTFGDAVIRAHQLERSFEWVGIGCEPGLPRINDLWGWDVVVVYLVPKKTGAVGTMPAVAWNVPDANTIIREAGKSGLMVDGEYLRWETATKWERTTQFGNYLKAGKSGGLDPKRWHGGWLPGQ